MHAWTFCLLTLHTTTPPSPHCVLKHNGRAQTFLLLLNLFPAVNHVLNGQWFLYSWLLFHLQEHPCARRCLPLCVFPFSCHVLFIIFSDMYITLFCLLHCQLFISQCPHRILCNVLNQAAGGSLTPKTSCGNRPWNRCLDWTLPSCLYHKNARLY